MEIPQTNSLSRVECQEVLGDEDLSVLGTPPFVEFVQFGELLCFIVQGLDDELGSLVLVLHDLNGSSIHILDSELLLLLIWLKFLLELVVNGELFLVWEIVDDE